MKKNKTYKQTKYIMKKKYIYICTISKYGNCIII